MLADLFRKLGLETMELKTYLALLEHGSSSAAVVARRLGIPRSSVYGFLGRLNERGLVQQAERGGVKLWQADDPGRLRQLISDERSKWASIEESFEQLLPQLHARRNADYLAPRFSFFEGVEGVKSILRDVLMYRDIVTQCFWPAREMIDILGDRFMAEHNRQRIRQKLYIQSIWPESKVIDIGAHPYLGVGGNFFREIRKAPPQIDCSMGYWAYSNKVGFVSSRKECFGFIVESTELREMLKTQFDVLWINSTPLKVTSSAPAEFLKSLDRVPRKLK